MFPSCSATPMANVNYDDLETFSLSTYFDCCKASEPQTYSCSYLQINLTGVH